MSLFEQLLNKDYSTKENKKKCNELMQTFFTVTDLQKREYILNEALYLDPYNSNMLVQYGLLLIFSGDKIKEYYGYVMLERAFNVEPCVPIHSYQGRWLASMIGRYNHLMHKYVTADKFFNMANRSKYNPDDTNKLQIATNISSFPLSIADSHNIIKNYNKNMDKLLKQNQFKLTLMDKVDYNFYMLSAFNFELYYNANIKECMQKHYLLSKKVFPELHYISKKIKKTEATIPYKLGIISAFFTKNNSVIADFGGVIQRLPRELFDITFIYLVENHIEDNLEFIYPNEKHIIIKTFSDTNWLENTRKSIENLELDLLFYLDSTMSSVIQRTMMSKLAPKQAVSHGHPVTSGIDKNIMNYFISWHEAEIETAQEHYTENLILLRKGHMHQYYSPRINSNGNSIINGKTHLNITRDFFSKYVKSSGNWYTCMQKPFKLHPEFDTILEKIILGDPNAKIILHDTDNEEQKNIFMMRYKKFKNNIYFIPMLPHNELIGLYNVSDVILDSYYAGGCTTTREALEIGAIVVTLPGKYLGGRWSLGYYNIMGVLDLVANTKDEYVSLALKYGINKEENLKMKTKILNNVTKLFYSEEAVNSWVIVFNEIINNK